MLLNPLATVEQLKLTPSMEDGLPHHVEMELRALGCQMIQQTAILLRLPQRTAAVAQVFFHRFWFTSSMRDFSARAIALGALLLSTKLEETQVLIRHLLNAYHFVTTRLEDHAPSTAHEAASAVSSSSESSQRRAQRYQPLAYNAVEFDRLRDDAMVAEMQILKRLGFHVQVVLPHALLPNYLQALGLAGTDLQITVKADPRANPIKAGRREAEEPPQQRSFAQCAWSLLNDALQTPVLCLFGPQVVACAAIALAAELCVPRVMLPVDPAPWWLVFDASEPEIRAVCSHLLWRYRHPPSPSTTLHMLDRHEVRSYITALGTKPAADPHQGAGRESR